MKIRYNKKSKSQVKKEWREIFGFIKKKSRAPNFQKRGETRLASLYHYYTARNHRYNKDFGPVSDFKSDSNVLIATDNGIYMINGRSVVAQKGQLLAYRCPLTNRWELYEN